jgi:putative polyhydroxyalkanoate system protein
MARSITISIPHSLGRDEARNRIAAGFGRLRDQMTGGLGGVLSLQNRWEGDRLHFSGIALSQTLSGRLDVADDVVQMHLDLPEMLSALAELIQRKLQKVGQQLLEEK